MNYKEEIIKLIDTITQDNLLQFFYALLRVATSDPDAYDAALSSMGSLFAVKNIDGI